VGISIWGFTGLDMGVLNATDDAATSVSDSSAVDWGSTSTPSGGAAARGKAVFEANGCMACHSIDGSKKIGPSLKGIWGTEQVHADGSTAVMDEDYFKESVLEPQARIVEGYGSAMPSYQDLVTPEELAELAAYVKSLQ
jgi:cytochrome c2